MDRKLQLIAHLYGEDLDQLEPLSSLLDDPELRLEYDRLGNTRSLLEQQAPVRPSASVVESIVAASAGSTIPARGADRAPLRRVSLRRIWMPALSAAAIVVFFAVSLWPTGGPAEQAAPTVAAEREDAASKSVETLLGELPPAPAMAAAPVAEPSDELEWDTGSDMRHLYRRIEAMRAAGLDGWDEPAVPLEFLPTGGADSRLLQTGGERPPGLRYP